MSMQQLMLGVTPAVIELGATKNLASGGGGGAGVASVSVNADGSFTGTVTPAGSGAFSSTWITPQGAASGGYSVRATLNSGAVSSGTTGSDLALSSNRVWQCVGAASANLTLEIKVGGTVRDSVTVTLAGS